MVEKLLYQLLDNLMAAWCLKLRSYVDMCNRDGSHTKSVIIVGWIQILTIGLSGDLKER